MGSTNMFQVSEINHTDIPELFVVRVATRENALSLRELEILGINEESVAQMLNTSHRGWLCEEGDRVVGFAMGDRRTGELWVIALLPDWEEKGIGKLLMEKVESWLWSEGFTNIWLTTDIDISLRAYGFYLHLGWYDDVLRDGLRYMKKNKP